MSKDYIRGPWHVGPVDDTCITDDNGEAVAYVEGDYDSSPHEMEVRARLISAAPELLEALNDLLSEAEDVFVCMADATGIDRHAYPEAFMKARYVIAKASPVDVPDEPHRPMIDHVSGRRIRERERRY